MKTIQKKTGNLASLRTLVTGHRSGSFAAYQLEQASDAAKVTKEIEGFTGSISVSGTITATGDVTASSDARLKTDVEPVSDALDRVRKLRGVTFTRRDTSSRGIGLVAQELAPIVPEAVMTHDDGLMSVAYGNLVGLLIEAIKELADQTKLQAQAITNLEAQR